jgi:glycosyltransferase involved in cell wall biosynthesis
MKLSVCLIVKNEERFLKQCLERIEPYAYEIIIVDTGSTDNTIEIAKSFSKVRLKHFTWINDFSAARNYCHSFATGDWILYIDADEMFEYHEDFSNIEPAIYNAKFYNVTGELFDTFNNDENTKTYVRNNAVISYSPRLFPNDSYLKLSGVIHETVQDPEHKYKLYQMEKFDLLHFGYTDQIKKEKEKDDRNLPLLLEEYNKNPEAIGTCHCLGQQYHLLKKYTEARKYLEKGISLFKENDAATNTFKPLLLTTYSATLSELDDYDKMLELSKENVLSPDFYLNLSKYFSSKHNEKEMLKCAINAMSFQSVRHFLPISYDQGSLTWKPCTILADYYSDIDRKNALFWYEMSVAQGCGDIRVFKNIATLHVQVKNPSAAIEVGKKIFESTKDPNDELFLANCMFNSNMKKEAIEIFNRLADDKSLEQIKNFLIDSNDENIKYVRGIKKYERK